MTPTEPGEPDPVNDGPIPEMVIVPWVERFAAADRLAGRKRIKGNLYAHSIPPEHPKFPGWFVSRIDIRPKCGCVGVVELCIITLTYDRPQFIPGMDGAHENAAAPGQNEDGGGPSQGD